MSTLTQAAIFSKKAFFWGLIAIAVIIALFIFLGIGRSIKNALFPPGPMPATVAFGKIPRMDLAIGYKAPGGVSYTLQTISGDFPALPNFAKVFAIGVPESSFGTLDRIKKKAENIDFGDPPTEVSAGVFKFVDTKNEGRVLTVDSNSESFTLETNYLSDPEVIAGHPESEKRAIDVAVGFLEDYGLDLGSYPEDKIETRKLRIDGSALTQVPAISGTNLVEVNFIRSDLDGVPVFWEKKNEAGITILVSANGVVFAKVKAPIVLKHKFATYPLKTPAAAFEDLKNGRGAFNKPVTTSAVTIIDVSLGYIETEKTSRFLQPVCIFKTADGSLGYVPAVDEKWID